MAFVLYNDRAEAGRAIASTLGEFKDRPDVVVLALPRGGVVVGAEIARALRCPMDVLPVCKLFVPDTESLEMGAIAMGGTYFLDDDVIREFAVPAEAVASAIEEKRKEVERLAKLYRGTNKHPDVSGEVVMIVDDGLATGALMRAAVDAVRKHSPARVLAIVPVCAMETCTALMAYADKVICLTQPTPFERLQVYYRDFPEISEAEVLELLHHSADAPIEGVNSEQAKAVSEDALSTLEHGWKLDL